MKFDGVCVVPRVSQCPDGLLQVCLLRFAGLAVSCDLRLAACGLSCEMDGTKLAPLARRMKRLEVYRK